MRPGCESQYRLEVHTGAAIEPCENPRREWIPGDPDPDLWLPLPCETCGPCRARSAVRAA